MSSLKGLGEPEKQDPPTAGDALLAVSGGRTLGFAEVPKERIAQSPLLRRDEARLMVLDRKTSTLAHRKFFEILEFFRPGDVLVLNDVRIFPARLFGRKTTGGKVTMLLLRRCAGGPSGERWTALLTPSLKDGTAVLLEEGVSARVEGKNETGEYVLSFSRDMVSYAERRGAVPLPPYIRRPAPVPEEVDRRYYQTVYAQSGFDVSSSPSAPAAVGAVAAPTAGLHFTEDLLEKIRRRGVSVAALCLKVGWGTFRPIGGGDYRQHRMLPEEYFVPEGTASAVNEARRAGSRVWAVGTTAVRALESAAAPGEPESGASARRHVVRAGGGETDLFIHPGYRFRVVDALITNFHIPGYTPLLMAAAFAGADFLRQAYDEALRKDYRFYSYGDAMVIL